MTHNLPTALTTFVGRDEELVEVARLVGERRLVTLTGVGGSGKSRLAAEVAAGIGSDDGPDAGLCWLDLGTVSDPDQVPWLTASALGVLVEPDGDPILTMTGRLRDRSLVLCLDTCEHLLDGTAVLVEALLRTCHGVAVLATSREPLGIQGETVWRVPSLKEAEAVRLFADRAALVSPEFSVAVHDPAVRAVCRRVDGMPLAIELAAAWVPALSPAQIATGLDDCFRLLAGGPRGALPRHRTLIASMDWSHDLLDDAEKVVFRRLAAFLGDFTIDAARTVCTDARVGEDEVLAILRRLVDKSLVVVRRAGAEVRYRLLDTVRQYAEQRLASAGETAAIRDRHLDHFLALAERAEPELERDQDTWRQILDSHRDDIAAAVDWGLSTADGQHRARRLSAAMARQWFVRGQTREGIEFLDRAMAADAADRSVLQARLLAGQALLGMVSGRRQLVAESAERGLRIASETGDDGTRARCLMLAAFPQFFLDFARCHELATEAWTLGAEAGDPFARDWGKVIAAYSLTTRDRHQEAASLARSALEQSLPRGDRFCAGFARGVELFAMLYAGNVRRAVTIADDMMAIVGPLGDYFAVGTNTTNAAVASGLAGDFAGARRMMDSIVRSIHDAPDVDVVGLTVTMGLLNLWEGHLEEAVSWFRRSLDQPSAQVDRWTMVRCLPGLAGALRRLGRLDEAAGHAAHGVALAREYGAPYVLADALDEQGFLAADSDPVRALELHHEALVLRRDSGLRTFFVNSLEALADLARRAGRLPDAVRMLAAADAAREDMGYPRFPVDQPVMAAAVASLRTELGDSRFDAAWAEGAALTLDEAVAAATRGRGRRDRPAAGWASLTSTEVEVVRLVAGGLTNPEIARRLFVSRATVKTHLSHIYAKLDVANRTELATLAGPRLQSEES